MRKTMLFIFCSILLFSMSYAESSIDIKSPNGGEVWKKNSTYQITWTKSGVQDSKVKIRLYDPSGTVKKFNVTNDPHIPNNGSFSWTIPDSCPTGVFIVRVKTLDNQVSDDSNSFTIKSRYAAALATDPKIHKITVEVTRPKGGFVCNEGSTINIRWRSNYKGAWKLGLFRDDKDGRKKAADLKSVAAQHLGEQHQVKVKIPQGVSAYPFRVFRVRVGVPNPMSKIVGWSKKFSIRAPLAVIERGLYPAERNDCGNGKKITYSWMGNLEAGGLAPTHKSKTGKYRVGFEHHYKTDGAEWYYFGYIFRSYVKFDLSEFVGKPGFLTKAYLRIEKAETQMNPGMANVYKTCASLVYRLSAGFSKNACLSMPGDNLAILPHKKGQSGAGNVTDIGSTKWNVDIRNTVRNWINHPETNFGLLLIPFKETLDKSEGNSYCVTYYRVKLIVEYVLSKK